MKKEWYAIFFILFGLPLCALLIGLFIPFINPIQNTTEIQEKPGRIVSLAPNLTEILFELGLNQNIVAVTSDSDYPAEAANKQKVGTFWQPNTEAIIACKPDLVVALDFQQQKLVADTLNRLGYKTLTLKREKIEELWIAIEQIGTATGCRRRADELTKLIKKQLKELQIKPSSADRVRILWIIQPEPLRIAGRNTFINELIELAGGENAIGPTIQPYPSISAEELLACGAEVIIQSAMDSVNIEKQQKAAEHYWEKYPNLPAVKNKRIYVLDSDAILRLGPRLPQAVEEIGRCIYPEIFINDPAEYVTKE
jgi:iron complex transport system substrate-binding protein